MMTFRADADAESIVLRVDDPFMIRDLIRESRTLDHEEWNIAVRWTPENVQALRELGYDVPDVEHKWPGPFTPFAHQLEMIDFRLKHTRCFDLSEQGAMKTAPSVWAADYLMKQGKIRKALVICPLSTMELVWQKEIYTLVMHRTCAVVHGSRERRERAIDADVDFYIINHDGIKLGWLRRLLRARTDIDLVIVDEGGMFRDGTTDKFKALEKMLHEKKGYFKDARVWWLTGTPCPNYPTDAWSQVRIINPDNVPEWFGAWKTQTMVQVSNFKWAKRRGAEKLVHAAMQPALRFLKKDCIDLPAVLPPISLRAELTAMQVQAFKAMQQQQLATIGDREISAVHAADELGKLRQILCGCVRDTATGEYIDLDFGPRVKVLREAIEGAEAKVIVIVPFKGVINRLAEEVQKFTSVGVINGDVPRNKRLAIIQSFKETDTPHVLLCHPRVMSHGLNLTEADRIIFYAPIFSNDEYEQVIERFNRMGQARKMTIIRIVAHLIEQEIYNTVDDKGINQKSILNLYRAALAA